MRNEMEKESITIRIEGHVLGGKGPNTLHDRREFIVQSTRGEVIQFLDEICTQIESKFEQ